MIRGHHQQVQHIGTHETLTSIRQIHWIVRGQEVVKGVIKKCVVCLMIEGKLYPSPTLPYLPEERTSEGPPFYNTGVNFTDPLYVKSTQAEVIILKKNYVSFHMCLNTSSAFRTNIRFLSYHVIASLQEVCEYPTP